MARSPAALILVAALVSVASPGCVEEKEADLAYLVTPSTLVLADSRYDGDPASGTVSFLNQDEATLYVTPTAISGNGADFLVVDTGNFTKINPGDSGDLKVSVTDDTLIWDEIDATVDVTFSLDADRTETFANGSTSDTWLNESLLLTVRFSLRCDLDGDGDEAEACAGTDCDDEAAAINAEATEVCDGVDNDCDGTADEDDASDASTWYGDDDGDDFGDPTVTTVACEMPRDYADNALDCDDTDGAVSPDDTERCDGVDNDCDGTTDESDASNADTFYTDADADTYGDPDAPVVSCDQPQGTVENDRDCDDTTAEAAPGHAEVCDSLDNDCDGIVDDGVCEG